MKAMNWILGAVAAAAILAPLQGANAWGGGPYGGGDDYESYPSHYRGGDYYGGDRGHYRGHYRGHRGYYGRHRHYGHHGYYGRHRHYGHHGDYGHHGGYYRGHRSYYGRPGDYGRPGYGYRGPVVVAPPLPPPPRW